MREVGIGVDRLGRRRSVFVTSIEDEDCDSSSQLSMRPTRDVAKGSGEGGGQLDEALSITGPSN